MLRTALSMTLLSAVLLWATGSTGAPGVIFWNLASLVLVGGTVGAAMTLAFRPGELRRSLGVVLGDAAEASCGPDKEGSRPDGGGDGEALPGGQAARNPGRAPTGGTPDSAPGRHSFRAAAYFETAARLAHAAGAIGLLIGLVAILFTLDDPRMIGPSAAFAFLTVLYGIILAELICIPLARRAGGQATTGAPAAGGDPAYAPPADRFTPLGLGVLACLVFGAASLALL